MRKRLIIVAAVALSACTLLLGKTYKRLEPVPGGMGVIYIYPDPKLASLRSAYVDKDPRTEGVTHEIKLVKKGYYPYLVSPGLVRVLSGPENTPSCAMIAVTAGSSHWVRVAGEVPRVVAVPQVEAEREMSAYREISTEARSAGVGNFPSEDCSMPAEQ